MTNISSYRSLNSLISTDDFIDWIMDRATYYTNAFHLTVRYNASDCISSANSQLKAFSGRFFRTAFGGNIDRPNNLSRIFYVAFLDFDGSKHGQRAKNATNYHHHTIILTDRTLYNRAMAVGQPHPSDESALYFPKVAAMGFLESHMLQPIDTRLDLRRATAYAALPTPELMQLTADAFLMPRSHCIIPEAHQVMPLRAPFQAPL